MRRNRRNRKKYRARQAGSACPVPLAVPLVLVVVGALFYLHLEKRCEAQGHRIQQLETVLRETESRRMNEEFKWQALRSPALLERALRTHGLRMEWPDRDRLVQVSYDPSFGQPTTADQQAWASRGHVRRAL